MNNRLPGLPPGFRDLLFDQTGVRRRLEAALSVLFEEQGFREISPSSVEYLDTYTRGNQHIRDEAIRYLDRNDHLLALRADFTPAIARIVAGLPGESAEPLRIWYAGSVFRKVGMHQGRFCEFRQIGAEIVGVGGCDGDAAIIDIALRCLTTLGIHDAVVHVNHADVFRGVVQELALDEQGLRLVQAEIDRKDARGLERRLEALGITGEVRKQVHALTRLVGGSPVLRDADRVLTNPLSRSAVAKLNMLATRLSSWGEHIVFDLTEVDELEYYTGMMCTFVSPRSTNEIGKGGRYDSLLSEFGEHRPAVGFSLSVDSLVEIL